MKIEDAWLDAGPVQLFAVAMPVLDPVFGDIFLTVYYTVRTLHSTQCVV